jgi:hypothetical protein
MRHFFFIAAAAGLLVGCASTQGRPDIANADRPYCLNDTGSRIPAKPGQCNGPGRSISRDEMDRTGAFTTFDAIRRIEPSAQ